MHLKKVIIGVFWCLGGLKIKTDTFLFLAVGVNSAVAILLGHSLSTIELKMVL